MPLQDTDTQGQTMQLHWSIFGSRAADRILRESGDWADLLKKLQTSGPHISKESCPWVKLARFGEQRTAKGSLRHDENVQEIYGIEGDYDGEQVQPEQAVALLEAAQIRAVVYTSPSHTPDKPRWRVLCPLSTPHAPHQRYAFLARVNGALGGILSPESFTLSQSYYFGRVAGEYKVLVTFEDPEDGICVDQLDELDNIAIGKPATTQRKHDDSPDGEGWGDAEILQRVKLLGRKLRTGDGRHMALVRAANSLSAQNIRKIDTVVLMLDALVQKYFDPTDPPAPGALRDIARHAVERDNRKESEAAALAEGLLAGYRRNLHELDTVTGEILPADTSEGLPFIHEVPVWREDAQLPVPAQLRKAPHHKLELIVQAIMQSAETTDRALSMCGAIHLASCTVARKVKSNRANCAALYLGTVARTGRGKNAAKNFSSKAMVRAFGISSSSDFTSASSLFTLLKQNPAAVLHLDEFGDKLRHGLKDANGSPVVKGFSALKEIYSQADDILSPSAFSMIAMSTKQRAEFMQQNAPIQMPHLNILAVTTPGQLADAITDASVEGGLMNRFLFITASGDVVENEDFNSTPPEWIVEYMREVSEKLTPNNGGNLQGLTDDCSTLIPETVLFSFCNQSMDALNMFKKEIKDLGKSDEFMADMSQRWRENAMRMALAIHAFCEPENRTILPSITQWCIDYCRYYGKKFALRTLELAQPSEKYGQRRKAYLQAFREHPEGMSSDKLGKMSPWRNDAPSFRNGLIADMIASGEIARVIGEKPARGRAPRLLVALQC